MKKSYGFKVNIKHDLLIPTNTQATLAFDHEGIIQLVSYEDKKGEYVSCPYQLHFNNVVISWTLVNYLKFIYIWSGKRLIIKHNSQIVGFELDISIEDAIQRYTFGSPDLIEIEDNLNGCQLSTFKWWQFPLLNQIDYDYIAANLENTLSPLQLTIIHKIGTLRQATPNLITKLSFLPINSISSQMAIMKKKDLITSQNLGRNSSYQINSDEHSLINYFNTREYIEKLKRGNNELWRFS